MKDLLSKEHYFPKIHTLLMEKSHYRLPPFNRKPRPIWITPNFYKKNLDTPSMIFQKSQLPLK